MCRSVFERLKRVFDRLKRVASASGFLLTDIPSEEQENDGDECNGVIGSEASIVELGVVRQRFPVQALCLHSLVLQKRE